ncbi:MAG: AMP-binding protein, partial [Casimicrobiaceae bacterium]
MAKSALRPLLQGFSREATVTWWKGQRVSAQVFCAAVVALAARLPESRYVVNLCEHGPHFLLAGAGAWCAGQVTLLPQDRLVQTLARLRDDYPEAYCLCDTSGAAQMARRCGMRVVDIVPDEHAGVGHWPPPLLSTTQIVAILFTSGSTGESKPHVKSWGELVDGVSTFVGSFGPLPANAELLGSVAPQHMFGLETTVMLPLQSGTPLLPQRPVLPGDLKSALGAARAFGEAAVWLITTPLQLRAFHAAGYPGKLHRVITSTMPLSTDLAQHVERDWQVTVEEIYGCTEGGMLAHRRTAVTDVFSAGVQIRLVEGPKGRWNASSGHLPVPISLGDRLQRAGNEGDAGVQTFRLLGRDDDMAKIAGKRASLPGLTAKIVAIPGVQDAIVFLPSPTSQRVAAAIVAPGLADAELATALAAVMDGAFLPRPLLRVDVLPRTRAMKIAMAPLRDMAMSARVQEDVDAASRAPQVFTTSRSLPADHPALAGHFPGRPIVPGVVLLQWVEALLAEHRLAIREIGAVKFHAPLLPAEIVDIRVDVAIDR